MLLKVKLFFIKYINFWNDIVIENVERKKFGNYLCFIIGLCFWFFV